MDCRQYRSSVLVRCLLHLVLLATTACRAHQDRPKVVTAKVQVAELSTALELFQRDCHRYPTSKEGLQALISNPGITAWRGPYLKSATTLIDPWGRPYIYRHPGQHRAYDLVSLGQDGLQGGAGEAADVTNW